MDFDKKHLQMNANITPVEVLELCSKFLYHLSNHIERQYEPDEIEYLVKSAVVILESFQFFEHFTLNDEELTENQQCFKTILNEHLDKMQNSEIFPFVLRHMLQQPNAMRNAVLLDSVFSHLRKSLGYKFNVENCTEDVCNLNKNHQKMYLMVERIFEMPHASFDEAIERVLANIGFDILGYIFCEPESSILYHKCLILAEILCQRIRTADAVVMKYFVKSLFNFISDSNNANTAADYGNLLFKKCLKNNQFFDSIYCLFELVFKKLDLNTNGWHNLNARQFDYNVLLELSYILICTLNIIPRNLSKKFTFINEDFLTDINLLFL